MVNCLGIEKVNVLRIIISPYLACSAPTDLAYVELALMAESGIAPFSMPSGAEHKSIRKKKQKM